MYTLCCDRARYFSILCDIRKQLTLADKNRSTVNGNQLTVSSHKRLLSVSLSFFSFSCALVHLTDCWLFFQYLLISSSNVLEITSEHIYPGVWIVLCRFVQGHWSDWPEWTCDMMKWLLMGLSSLFLRIWHFSTSRMQLSLMVGSDLSVSVIHKSVQRFC